MRKASIFCAVLLSITALQMDSANASPFTRRTNRVRVQALSVSSLIDTAAEFVEVRALTLCRKSCACVYTMFPLTSLQKGLDSLRGASVCEHLQTVLTPLANLGEITLSTSGPPEPDQSLLNRPDFWEMATVQHASGRIYHYIQ